MSTNVTEFESWNDVLNHKARILYAQIAEIQNGVSEQGGDEHLIDELCEPYYELLKSMYAEDYPLAKAVEESDLVISLEGPAISRDNPRISIVTGVMGKVKTHVTRLAKALAHLTERGVPAEVDLGLSAFAKGSLVLGFTLPTAAEITEAQRRDQPLLAELVAEQRVFQAARDAIRTLGIVTQHVTEGRGLDELREIIPDPKVRDTALAAVKELAPTTRSGIQTVRISGREMRNLGVSRPLTPTIRESVGKKLERPVSATSTAETLVPITIVGDIREMDLDTHRFDLRHIENMEVNDLRCSYLDATDEEATRWLGKTARVAGIVERDASGKPQLLELTAPIEFLNSQPS